MSSGRSAPLRAVFERGIRDGVLQPELSAQAHLQVFASLVTGVLQAELQRAVGLEEAAATLASLYLDGAAARPVRQQRP